MAAAWGWEVFTSGTALSTTVFFWARSGMAAAKISAYPARVALPFQR